MKHTSRSIHYIVGWMVASTLLALAPATAALGPDTVQVTQEEPSQTECMDQSLHGVGDLVWPLVTACETTYDERKCTALRVVGEDVPVDQCEEEHTFRTRGHSDETWHCYTVWVAGQEVPVFGDPDHVALCREDFSPNEECYILMVQGEHYNGWYICILY